MKTNLKILHETPDLDELASRHQNFDALMDAYTDEKIRKRKKFYKAGSFVLVILATAFFSWLYWGYAPAVEPSVKSEVEEPLTPSENVLPVEQKEQLTEPVTQAERVPVPEEEVTELDPVTATKKPEVLAKEETEEEIAKPQITIREKITADATPVDGLENLYRYLYKEIELPDSILETDNTFFLEVEFEVGAEGKIGEISFNKELPAELTSRLSKVFDEMPAWKPALEQGDAIASVINLPITFQKKGDKE